MPQAQATTGPGKLTLAEKVIEQIRVSDLGMQKAAAALSSQQEKQAQVGQLIPQVVETMVQFERIQPSQREKLAEALRDPAQVLQLLIKVAGHRNADEIARLGHGVNASGEKTASENGQQQSNYNSLTNPYVGQRTPMVKQSSMKLFAGLGLQSPVSE